MRFTNATCHDILVTQLSQLYPIFSIMRVSSPRTAPGHPPVAGCDFPFVQLPLSLDFAVRLILYCHQSNNAVRLIFDPA